MRATSSYHTVVYANDRVNLGWVAFEGLIEVTILGI